MKSLRELLGYKEVIRDNILEIYNQATLEEVTGGQAWYTSAHLFCKELAKDVGKPVMNVIGVLSALSPRCEWGLNKEWTKLYFEGNYKHTRVQTEKCHRIVKAKTFSEISGHLGGLKTKNFFGNILYPEDKHFVTIDSHVLKICSGLYIERVTPCQYTQLKKHIQEISEELSMLPNSLLGTAWLTYKRVKPKYYKAKKYE